MMRKGIAFSIVFLCLTLVTTLSGTLLGKEMPSRDSYYELGKKKLEAGEWEIALRVWLQGIVQMQESNEVDPRLSFSFIETATFYEAEEYYNNAHVAYYWGLDIRVFERYFEQYKEEIERLLPLMERRDQRRVKQKLRSRDSTVLYDIRTFWDVQDPVLSTEKNERLLEHWERLAFARKHFKKNKRSVYNTDDRGTIYIRYGAPSRRHTGSLFFNSVVVRTKASELIDLLDTGSQSQNDTSATIFSSNFSAATQHDVLVENIVRSARDVHKYSQYEIWIYDRFDIEFKEKAIFIFGEDGDNGTFGLRNSAEDMIASEAFGVRADQVRTTGVPFSAGLLLQLMVYNQLSSYDTFFNDRYLDIESNIFSKARFNSSYIDVAAKNESEFKLQRLQAQLPQEESSLVEELAEIEVSVKQYRMLNEYNEPTLLVAIFSKPHNALFTDVLKRRQDSSRIAEDDFRLLHSLKMVTDSLEVTILLSDTAQINLVSEASGNELAPSSSVFSVPNLAGASNLAGGELFNIKPLYRRKIFPSEMIGLGKLRVEHPEPLDTDVEQLEMSDLILGYSKSSEPLSLPFIISRDNVIPEGENLVVHFEVYHLKEEESGSSRFELEYRVQPQQKGFFRRMFGARSDELSLKLYFDQTGSSFREDLEIETGKFDSGVYELVLKATDLQSGREVTRTSVFEIAGENEKE